MQITIAEDSYFENGSFLKDLWESKNPVLVDPKQVEILKTVLSNLEIRNSSVGSLPDLEQEKKSEGLRTELSSTKSILASEDTTLQKTIFPTQFRFSFLSSGSTKTPTPFLKTEKQIWGEVQVLQSLFPKLYSSELAVVGVPYCYIYGFLFGYMTQVVRRQNGFPGIVKANDLSEIKRTLEKDVAVFVTVPSQLEALVSLGVKASPQQIFTSGSFLSQQLRKKVVELWGSEIVEVYGSTETGGIAFRVTGLRTQQSMTPLHDYFQIFPDVSVKTSEENLLEIRSPFLSENLEITDEGFWISKDLGAIHENGQLEIFGRVDRVIKRKGKRLSLVQLEEYWQSIWGLEFVVAITTPDVDGSLEPFITCVAPSQNQAEVLNHPIENFLFAPNGFHFLDSVPRLYNGKIDLQEVQKLGKGKPKQFFTK